MWQPTIYTKCVLSFLEQQDKVLYWFESSGLQKKAAISFSKKHQVLKDKVTCKYSQPKRYHFNF